MRIEKFKQPGRKPAESVQAPPAAKAQVSAPPPPAAPARIDRLFRPLDWIIFAATTLLVFIGYYLTLAPDLTLEDAGELAVGSYYAGVPHPPGYPVWTIYTWLFTVLIPFSNIAWRVALSSAVAAAFSCGLLALLVSRGSSLLLESMPEFQGLNRRWESFICAVSGFVAGMLLGFNGFMWSQAVIVEVYTLSVLSFMGVLCCLFRWIYSPEQRKYLYWAFFLFGICFTNHQTLIVAAMGIEILVLAAQPKLGRDLMFGNSIIYIGLLFLKRYGVVTAFDANPPLYLIFNLIGLSSVAICAWLTYHTRQKLGDWLVLGRDLLLSAAFGYALCLALVQAGILRLNTQSASFLFFHILGAGFVAGCAWLTYDSARASFRNVDKLLLGFGGAGVLYLLISMIASFSPYGWITRNAAFYVIFHLLGFAALFGTTVLAGKRSGLGSEVKVLFVSAGVWLLGASFYFYMPIASMTNPPMNWGYPRTVEGFIHALTRGQYDKTQPTDDLGKFIDQIGMYISGASNEFSPLSLLIGLVPFAFYRQMQKRERAWLVGLAAIGFCLAILLLILLNPNTDLQSRQQSRVFFTASHIMIAIAIGYGLTLISGALATQYREHRFVFLCSAAVAVAIELFSLVDTYSRTQLMLQRAAGVLALVITAAFLATILIRRVHAPLPVFLALFAIIPARSVLSHWAENEQRGHLFGYWFGHDMFKPPFGIYPEMERNAILFGGTDPGRFNPTYMIFCESFIAPKHKPRDPEFDRRDVYIITQNALADGTYLDYIRAHYNRSTQQDPYFFSELFRTQTERELQVTNVIARALLPIDRYFTDLGARIEAERRRRGVYPPKEINTPSKEDSQIAFQEYLLDAQRRLQHDMQFPTEPKQLKPGEDVRIVEDRVQVSGQVAVMAINGLLTKVIFDENPTNEFYVEESFPLDWMFPYLSPYGIIMKINRNPLPSLTEEMLDKDHRFWRKYSERLIGDWIDYDTPVKEICEFAQRTYLRHDFTGFTGDRKFIRDDFAQKAFSKLRSAIGGLYAWRLSPECPEEFRPKTAEEFQRLMKEADFALRQSFAFCPYSPEAVYKYVNLLLSTARLEDAQAVAETSLLFDPTNLMLHQLVNQLKSMLSSQAPLPVTPRLENAFAGLDQQFQANPNNLQLGLQLADAYVKSQRTGDALRVLNQVITNPAADVSVLLSAAQSFAQLGNRPGVTATVQKLALALPELETKYRAATNDIPLAFQLVSVYLLTQKREEAVELVDELVARPNADASTLFSAATVYSQLTNATKLESTLQKLVAVMPQNPEAWYDLAAIQAMLGKNAEALKSVQKAVSLSDARLRQQPGARDLRTAIATDARLAAIRNMPGFPK